MADRPFVDTPQFKIMRTIVGAANPLVRRILESRYGGKMAASVLLLQFTGRTSGRTFRTPVGYVRRGDRIVIVTSPTYRWWKNVVGGADVRVRVAEGWRAAHARVVTPDDVAYDSAVALQVAARGPGMLRGFGVDVADDGAMTAEAKASASERAHIVEVVLPPSAAAATADATGDAASADDVAAPAA